ncbi:hypothetical protein A2U01_0061993, partial [Trifolium medium]|nr:hypothetical protein [Trifolium medium]
SAGTVGIHGGDKMNEEYSPKQGIRTLMENILDGGTKSDKVLSA